MRVRVELAAFDVKSDVTRPYERVDFPEPPANRPYVFVNMIATLDGKILSGERDEPVADLGTKVDYQALRDLESHAQAIMVGAQTVRATPKLWFPNHLLKLVPTKSGDLPWDSRFFTDDPTKAIVISPPDSDFVVPVEGVRQWRLGTNGEFLPIFERLKKEGVRVFACEGGSELNAVLIREDLVDEFFLTVAPKIRLGRNVPTYAGGEPFARDEIVKLELVSTIPIGDEVYLRYRRRR